MAQRIKNDYADDPTPTEQTALEQAVAELGYEDLKAFRKKIDQLSYQQLKALVAYEYWKDGMEWKDVVSEWINYSHTRTLLKSELVNKFGY
jgi:hypothetical protein